MNAEKISNIEKPEEKPIKLKDIFKNLKSDYFLLKIFCNLNKKNALKIVKYNKNFQKRINLNINDYKNYSEIYSSIEIEIIPNNIEYGEFININKEDESYYHIYFNNNKKEMKKNYIKEEDNVNNINIIIDYQIKSFNSLFEHCNCIKSINFKKFYRNNINDMRCMFAG